MALSKTFPKTVPGSNYPQWEEVSLTAEEEQGIIQECSKENVQLMDKCLHEAKVLVIKHGINTDENVAHIAIALFEKRASHEVFWKESKAKEKFDHQ